MNFDVIIGNPPYQTPPNGNKIYMKNIYHLFVQQAIKIEPRYLCMIIPSRWFTTGKGLDEFRSEMINDKRMREIHDYLNANEVFSEVAFSGGVNYFLWDREYRGDCLIKTYENSECVSEMKRFLKEEGVDVFIRDNTAISILEKVKAYKEESFSKLVNATIPFGLNSTVKGSQTPYENDNVTLYRLKNIDYYSRKDIPKNQQWIDAHKVFVGKANNSSKSPSKVINKPFYGTPNTVCTQTYLLIGPFPDKETCDNVISYINTKFFRFLLSLIKITQNTSKRTYRLVPIQDFSKPWTDEELYKKYRFTKGEIEYIEKMIKHMRNL